ncbi:MAG: hypothetical protein EBY28_14590, partial [Betaproteobacteria bacterium]|nr:hypothetical protein [Betaproteobacteria bacterium]
MRVVKPSLTNRPCRPLTGWVRTTGCSSGGWLARAFSHCTRSAGGDTLWASGIAAWEALSAPWQRMLAGMQAEHDFLKSFPAHRFARTPAERVQWEKARANHPPLL